MNEGGIELYIAA